MIKRLLVSAAFSCFVGKAMAQAPVNLPSETFKQQLRNQYLRNDTAQAIINLYSRRQAGGVSWIVGGTLTAARAAASGAAGVGTVAILPFVAYGASKLVRFSNKNLAHTLTSYSAGQPLPRSMRRKLKQRFFAQPIIEYAPATTAR